MSQGKVLLIVDDDEDCRTSLGEVFESEGCKVYCAENGVHAFEYLAVVRPDLMIVDLMMPVMNGWDFCARLEKDPLLSDIPVVILTAVGRMHSFGRKRVLHKPVTLSTLTALLDLVDTPTPAPR